MIARQKNLRRPIRSRRITKGGFLFLLIFVGSLFLITPGSTQNIERVNGVRIERVNGHAAAAGQVLVKFQESTSRFSVNAVADSLDASLNVPVGGAGARLIESRSKDTATLIRELSARSDVVYAEPNYVAYGGVTPNDTQYFQLWNLNNTGQIVNGLVGTLDADVDADEAWDVSTGSPDSVVAVIDSGIDYNHPDLAANVWSAPAAFTVTIRGVPINCPAGSHGFNAITRSCDPLDDHNHGTHVSGTIGAVGNNGQGVAGVNWTTSIMAVKWLDANNSGFIANAIDAIEFAIQAKLVLGAGANVRVLNNSWFANNFSQAVGDEILRADANNMLFAALAGNNGTDNDVIPRTPSGHKVPNVIGVSATDNRDQLSSFSNFGKTSVHIGAPGSSVFSTLRGNSYGSFTGTSMATPHVAGAAALMLSRCSLTTAGLKGFILTYYDPIPSLVDRVTTGGRLNVNKAIRACAAVPNPADDALFFVRQHYVDFFGREPDPSGFAFWTGQITECQQPGATCNAEVRRINVSGAFFLSIEFQETGYLVYRMYKASYGNMPGAPVPLRFSEFLPDTQQIGQGVVVGQPDWQAKLESNKVGFAETFVSRPRFFSAYPTTLTPEVFVDLLYVNAGVSSPPAAERQSAINEFGGVGNTANISARSRALRRVAENSTLFEQEKNKAFVLSQYFGYLRRNPDDAPEPGLNFDGFNFWLGKLNQFNGNFVEAEMVKAFLVSGEYRQRFGL